MSHVILCASPIEICFLSFTHTHTHFKLLLLFFFSFSFLDYFCSYLTLPRNSYQFVSLSLSLSVVMCPVPVCADLIVRVPGNFGPR